MGKNSRPRISNHERLSFYEIPILHIQITPIRRVGLSNPAVRHARLTTGHHKTERPTQDVAFGLSVPRY